MGVIGESIMQSTMRKGSGVKSGRNGGMLPQNGVASGRKAAPSRGSDAKRIGRASGLGPEERGRFFALSLDLLSIVGFDGKFKELNPRWERLLGYSMDELLSTPFVEFLHPEDLDRTFKVFKELGSGGELVSFTNRYRHKDGHYLLLEWSTVAIPERELMYALARDVTERERMAAEQRATEERLQHLLRSSQVVLYSLRTSGDRGVTFISDNVIGQFGYEPRQFAQDPRFWADRIHPEDKERVTANHGALLERGSCNQEYRWLHKDGVHRWVHDDSKVVRDAEGNPLEIVGSWQDVTERQERELTIRRQSAALIELSTPLIPISDDIVVMPLVGVVDSRRAAQMLEKLLTGITQRSARVAILDITGVGMVDTQVAETLVRVAKAVKLLGAEIVLTGISAEVAQTLVSLGTGLTGLVMHGTLQAGIRYAMRRDAVRRAW